MIQSDTIFSWFNTPLLESKKTCQLLVAHQVIHIYQIISPTDFSAGIQKNLEISKENQIKVWFLIGEAEWALDPEAKEAVRLLEEYKAYRGYIEGVMVEIESYLLSDFLKKPE